MHVESGQTIALMSMSCYKMWVWTRIQQADEAKRQANLRTLTEKSGTRGCLSSIFWMLSTLYSTNTAIKQRLCIRLGGKI